MTVPRWQRCMLSFIRNFLTVRGSAMKLCSQYASHIPKRKEVLWKFKINRMLGSKVIRKVHIFFITLHTCPKTSIMLDLSGDNSFLYWIMTCQGVCCKFTSMVVEKNHFYSLPYIRVKFLYWSTLNIVSIVGIHVVLLCTLLKYWLFCIVK